MINTKKSVTYKIIIGYFLAGVLAVVSFWVINRQIFNYTEITKIESENSRKLSLISEVTAGLYETESLARNMILSPDKSQFDKYKSKIDIIVKTINLVGKIAIDTQQTKKIERIKQLIDSKNENLKNLIDIYKQKGKKGLQENVIDELKKSNDNFGNYSDYDKKFDEFTPEAKKALIAWLNYSKKDNSRLTNQTVETLANTFYKALSEIELKDRKYQKQIKDRENKLLKNDQIISKQLRDLINSIDLSERNQYYARLEASNEILNKTSDYILIIAAISFLIAIIFLFLITRDVSKSQKLSNALESEKIYTESLLKTRESLINTVTHDLRSPLNTVIGYSDLLERTKLNTKQKYYLDHLKKSSDYILHLVNDLLDLSKLEAGKMAIEELPFSPKKLIENTVASVIPFGDKKNLKIRIFSDNVLDNQYLGDPFRIKQILTNLLNNAYKFTNEGYISITSSIEQNTSSDINLIISVKDTGIGITKTQQQFIFEEFSQGDDYTEKKYGGFGLGLAITKKIVTLLNGKIALTSAVDEGSNFTISIPVKTFNSRQSIKQLTSNISKNSSDLKVLIVDDDPSQLALTSEVVSLSGLSCDVNEKVAEALALLQKNTYHLILTDIQMPIIDGFEFLKMIKKIEKYATVPVIAISGIVNTSPSDFKNAGFSGSLNKPYAPAQLIELINKTLNIKSKPYTPRISKTLTDQEDYSLHDLTLFAQGDQDSLQAILNTFYDSTSGNIQALKTEVENKDEHQIKKIAHKMLPMFRQIKAKEIVPLLSQMEDPEHYNLDLDPLLQLSQESITKIEGLIKKLKTEN